jgi:single-stranded-DNA-specific exonuclease
MKLTERTIDSVARTRLLEQGVEPRWADLYARRGIQDHTQVDHSLPGLPHFSRLKDIERASQRVKAAIESQALIVVIADYDCDGATACAVMVRGLARLGARLAFVVPDRFIHGYGLSPALVELAHKQHDPQLLITVDQGISSLAGVVRANQLGIEVIVTDHHLPGTQLPSAYAILNPNQHGCGFAGLALAGVGIALYLVLAVRAALRSAKASTVPMDDLLPLVALGTVADIVTLDHTNRILVAQGLGRLRKQQAPAGLLALLEVSGKSAGELTTRDLGFSVGPRINAAGRLRNIRTGIECMIEDDPQRALCLARELDGINRERRGIEQSMRTQALDTLDLQEPRPACVVMWQDGWHEGLVGLVASRLKERAFRPAFALAPARQSPEPDTWRGSGRSIPGLHLRDALDWVDRRYPGVLIRFGGHAMAAGVTVASNQLSRFARAIDEAVTALCDPAALNEELLHDGPLQSDWLDLESLQALDKAVWGQGFAEPMFAQGVEVLEQSVLKSAHLRVRLRLEFGGLEAPSAPLPAIWFGRTQPLPARCQIAFQAYAEHYQGMRRVGLHIRAMKPFDTGCAAAQPPQM